MGLNNDFLDLDLDLSIMDITPISISDEAFRLLSDFETFSKSKYSSKLE